MGIGSKKAPTFMTYEQMCLNKLEEIGKSTLKEWATAMGLKSQNSMSKIVVRLKDELIISRNKSRRLHYYEVKK